MSIWSHNACLIGLIQQNLSGVPLKLIKYPWFGSLFKFLKFVQSIIFIILEKHSLSEERTAEETFLAHKKKGLWKRNVSG